MLTIAARVGRILVLAVVPIVAPVLAAPSSVGASVPRSDRLPTADDNQVVRTVTVEERTANTSTLTRVPVAQ